MQHFVRRHFDARRATYPVAALDRLRASRPIGIDKSRQTTDCDHDRACAFLEFDPAMRLYSLFHCIYPIND